MPLALFALGSAGLLAPRIGLGVMSAAFYGSADTAADEKASLDAIDAYVALCSPAPAFLDTAWIYTSPSGLHSESIVAKAIAKHGRSAFVIATKFGSSGTGAPPDSSRATLLKQYGESVARLGTTPDLYYQHRPDATRDVVDVVRDLAEMVADGRIRYIGLSECTAAELRRAYAVHPITAIQMEWSLAERSIEASIVPTCRELGVGLVAYSPLSRGLLTATVGSREGLVEGDRRLMLPRFAEGAIDENARKAADLGRVAARLGATPAQVSLAWLLRQGEFVFPIPGTKTVSRVVENVGAIELAERLSDAEVAEISALNLAATGARYAPAGLAIAFEAREAAAANNASQRL